MRTFITFNRNHRLEIPDKFKEYDNRSYEEVVEYFIKKFTKPGAIILDMFAGLGTTLIIAEELGRIPYGIEYLEDHCDYIISKIEYKDHVIHGDAKKLSEYDLPAIDFVYTSPLFMQKDETKDPLNGFKTAGDYNKYLNDLKKIFEDLKIFLKNDSRVVIEVSNLKIDGVTTLAWDIGKKISDTLYFEGEVIIGWLGPRDKESFNYDHSYCLVFVNKE